MNFGSLYNALAIPILFLCPHWLPRGVGKLEGHSPASPWFFGGYRGSIDYTRAALSLSDCEKLKSSWILTTEDGKRRISPDVLNS